MKTRASAQIWWVIIGAAIALVVLIILLSIFTGKIRDANVAVSDCESKAGTCVDNNCPQGTLKASTFSCLGDATCCIGTPKECIKDEDCSGGRKCKVLGGNLDLRVCQ